MAGAEAAQSSATAGSPAVGRAALTTFVLCALAMIAEGFDTYAVGYVGPALAKEWGLAPTVVGQMYAVGVVASLFGSLALGALSDWLGRKWLLIGSIMVFGLATIGSALAPDLTVLMITRILAGIGLGASIPCAMALATEKASARYRATVPVLMSACIGAGVVVASLSAAAVMPSFGWRGLMYVGAVFPLGVALAMIPLLPESLRRVRATGEAPAATWRALFEPRMALITVIVTAGFVATYTVTFFFGFWLPTLVGKTAPDVQTVGLASALIKTFSLCGSLTLGRLMDRYGSRRILPLAFVAAGAVLVLAVTDSPSLAVLVLSLGVASFFLDGAFSGIIGFGALVFPAHVRGTGIGFTIGVGRLLGGTLGPTLGGVLLTQGMGVKAICAVFAAPLLIAALMVLLAARLRAQDPVDA